MPNYTYEHPETGEIFVDLRPMRDRKKPFIAPDGVKCPFAPFAGGKAPAGWVKGLEGFEKDPAYYQKMNPKYVRFKDGHKERYDPSKHH